MVLYMGFLSKGPACSKTDTTLNVKRPPILRLPIPTLANPTLANPTLVTIGGCRQPGPTRRVVTSGRTRPKVFVRDGRMQEQQGARPGFCSALPLRAWRFYARFVRTVMTLISGTILLCLGVLFVNYVVLSTPKGHAISQPRPERCGLPGRPCARLDGAGRHRPRKAARRHADGRRRLGRIPAMSRPTRSSTIRSGRRCYDVPCSGTSFPPRRQRGRPIDFTLGFLEFQENGEPYALVSRGADADKKIDSAMIEHAMETEMHAKHMSASAVQPVITQLDVLKKHLATGSNFVVVFIHGWRHDARIGDQNVADLRLYAAHAARFIAQRCPLEPRYCDMQVTAIYVGWRGARVDEQGLRDYFGRDDRRLRRERLRRRHPVRPQARRRDDRAQRDLRAADHRERARGRRRSPTR